MNSTETAERLLAEFEANLAAIRATETELKALPDENQLNAVLREADFGDAEQLRRLVDLDAKARLLPDKLTALRSRHIRLCELCQTTGNALVGELQPLVLAAAEQERAVLAQTLTLHCGDGEAAIRAAEIAVPITLPEFRLAPVPRLKAVLKERRRLLSVAAKLTSEPAAAA